MNSIKTSALWILSSIFVVFSFSACSDDLNDIGQAPSVNASSSTNVRVVASGYVTAQKNPKALTRGNNSEFKAEDFIITPISEAEAEAKAGTRALTTGEAGDDGSTFLVYNWVTLLYSCKTADGTIKDLSELIVWPYGATPS